MHEPHDTDSLRALCAALAASDFDVTNRIKAIAQITHEYLGTSSLIVYAYNRITSQLDILAMPGASQRELMRGPTDKLWFAWQPPDSEEGRSGVWLDDDDACAAYLARLAKETGSTDNVQGGNFRERERQKHSNSNLRHDVNTQHATDIQLATAKLYLRKGLGQTNDKVGQVYFNFLASRGVSPFTQTVRNSIRYTCTLIRELLIERVYHKDVPSLISWAPERLLREFNNVFDYALARPPTTGFNAEMGAARIICEAALSVTENYGGYADLVFLIGERLGRVFHPHANTDPIRTILLSPSSITGTCVRDKKYFVGNDVSFLSDSSVAVQSLDSPSSSFAGWPREFDSRTCHSVMVVPVVHEGEVRAAIRLTSPRMGCFLDAQAHAMQSLEQFARYGVLRLDEWRQRAQMLAALNFYTTRMSPSTVAPPDLMQGVLSALGAQWLTFWPVERSGARSKAEILHGVLFTKDGTTEPLIPGATEYSIRPLAETEDRGFTQALMRMAGRGENAIFALHILPREARSTWGLNSEYYLQVFSKEAPPQGVSDWLRLNDDFNSYGVTDSDKLLDIGPISLNANTARVQHTRIAFVVWDRSKPRAVIWLKFSELHEISWWERAYIDGLSRSLGKLLQVDALDRTVRSFRHMIPNIASDALDRTTQLLAKTDMDADTRSDIERIETFIFTLSWKAAEVKSQLLPLTENTYSDHSDGVIGSRPFKEFIKHAVASATGFAKDNSAWEHYYGDDVGPADVVSGVFYSALLNVVTNIVQWGWRESSVEQLLAVIWIRRAEGKYMTTVGNTGNPVTNDTLESWPILPKDGEHGIGLLVVRDLLRQQGGDIFHVAAEAWLAGNANYPSKMALCTTFYEFAVPAGGDNGVEESRA